jgi:cell division protein YceG involved in septum cleavage
MKTKILILIISVISLIGTVQAQKIFKASDKIEGKTISQWAKEWDLKAFQDSKSVYRAGMSQETFIALIKSNFPTQTTESFKGVFVPYYEYIYRFHSRGYTDTQVLNSITGNETAAMISDVSTWNFNNPGQIQPVMGIPWKFIIECVIVILEKIVTIL